MFEWAYSGVNSSIPRNVGPDCAYYLSPSRKILETIFVTIFIVVTGTWALRRISIPKSVQIDHDRVGRRFLLFFMSLILGMEIGFKFNSRTVIYLLNPCHVITAVQLYLLSAKPSRFVTALFRVHLNFMNGPVLAYMFPETESRQIFADKAMYYIQHGLMVVIPYYLFRLGGVYNVEPLRDLSWCVLSYGINLAYHFLVLQAFALPVQVNLSHMLCPAVLDPFGGPNYRLWAFVHQSFLCPFLCKLISYSADFFITKFPLTRVKSSLELPIPREITKNDREESADRDNARTHID